MQEQLFPGKMSLFSVECMDWMDVKTRKGLVRKPPKSNRSEMGQGPCRETI